MYVHLSSSSFFSCVQYRTSNKMASHCNFCMHFIKDFWSTFLQIKITIGAQYFGNYEMISCAKVVIRLRGKKFRWKKSFFRSLFLSSLYYQYTFTHKPSIIFGKSCFFLAFSKLFCVCLDSRWISWISYHFAWWWRHQS